MMKINKIKNGKKIMKTNPGNEKNKCTLTVNYWNIRNNNYKQWKYWNRMYNYLENNDRIFDINLNLKKSLENRSFKIRDKILK